VERQPTTQTDLLSSLRRLEAANRWINPLCPRLEELAQRLDKVINSSSLHFRRILRLFAGRRRREAAKQALGQLIRLVNSPDTLALASEMSRVKTRLTSMPTDARQLWDDYTARPVVYNGFLVEVGGLEPQEDASQGFLPKEIVKRVNAFELNKGLLTASLRGYQSFGARYALVQERTILGDDMGLGKTIEALAVMCHLRSKGATHTFVVCPASVLANWEHEIKKHTRLRRVWRLHGAQREWALKRWGQQGGVAITTFATLGSLDLPSVEIAAVVVDEAHYIKNPHAKRTKAVRSLLAQSKHLLLMSGTPMENRVEEFRILVNHIRPEIASTISATDGLTGATAFRRAVAPVYLRRNQDDVLAELPDKIEVEEWLALDGSAAAHYRQAVEGGNFMDIRRAAFLTEHPLDSPKLRRLLEITEEAMSNHRKVVVFSFFLDVINRVCEALGSKAFGPLTGSVSGPKRQVLLDQFSKSPKPAVLVSQIEAGGVGLNIQAASVVILTEPQWKPSTEMQAIARCYRMGQVRPVEVHRLLTENSVDEHMKEVLTRKSVLFSEYATKSHIKDVAPEATDSTDEDRLVKAVSQIEQERRIIELERRRLGLRT
jgi:SNF2 family DNA or RNA helicase